MKEFVTANGKIYECKSATTGLDSITMTMENQEAPDLIIAFEDVSELTIAFGEKKKDQRGNEELILEEPHGMYKNLKLESVTTNVENGSVSVTMRIKTEIEIRLEALEESQSLQNGAIDELANIVGGGV